MGKAKKKRVISSKATVAIDKQKVTKRASLDQSGTLLRGQRKNILDQDVNFLREEERDLLNVVRLSNTLQYTPAHKGLPIVGKTEHPFGRNLLHTFNSNVGGWRKFGGRTPASSMPEELKADVRWEYDPDRYCRWGSSEQFVDLLAEGLTEEILDEVQPVIFFSQWVECRCIDSCLGLYASRIALVKEIECLNPYSATFDIPWLPNQTVGMVEWTKPHQNVERPSFDNRWEQIWCYIKDYGPGIRYVRVWYGERSVCLRNDCQGYRVAGSQVMALLKEGDVPDLKCLRPRGKTAKKGRKRNTGQKRPPTLKLQKWPSSAYEHPFTHRNLIQNGSAQDSHGSQEMQNWVVTTNGGEGWKVGKKSEDETHIPSQLEQTEGRGETFFCTSSEWCAREQVVDLLAEGFMEDFLDAVRPPIFVSTWYAGQFECGTEYQMSAELLCNHSAEGNSLIDSRQSGTLSTKAGEWRWRRIFYCFMDYQPGLRFIRFSDQGRGTEGGAGHHGAKVTGAEVRFVSPKTVYECYSPSH